MGQVADFVLSLPAYGLLKIATGQPVRKQRQPVQRPQHAQVQRHQNTAQRQHKLTQQDERISPAVPGKLLLLQTIVDLDLDKACQLFVAIATHHERPLHHLGRPQPALGLLQHHDGHLVGIAHRDPYHLRIQQGRLPDGPHAHGVVVPHRYRQAVG